MYLLYQYPFDIFRDGVRVSNMVTKTFEVGQAPDGPLSMREDGLDFVNDLNHDSGVTVQLFIFHYICTVIFCK